MKKLKNSSKGITLVALVVTIIVLIILASVSISLVLGDHGLLKMARDAKIKSEKMTVIENAQMDILTKKAENDGNDITEDEFVEILEKYGVLSEKEETSVLDKILTTANGGYEIEVKEIYNGEFLTSTPGLYYADTGELIMSWEDFINPSNYYITVNNNSITGGNGVENARDKNGQTIKNSELKLVFGSGITSINALMRNLGNFAEIELSDSVTKIGNSAFDYCLNLKKIKLSNSITEIGAFAFLDCNKLEEIKFPKTLTKIGGSAFKRTGIKTIKLPDSLTELGTYSFSYCSKLEEAVINGISIIPDGAFEYCTNLEKVEISDTVEKIGVHAFNICSKLKGVKLSNSLNEIKVEAFNSCSSLTEIKLPNSLVEIRRGAFLNSAITNIEIPASVKIIENQALGGNIEKLKINGIRSDIQNFSLGTSLSNGGYAKLETIILGEGIETISPAYGIIPPALKRIEIDKELTTIEDGTFSACSNLTDVYYKGTNDEWDEINVEITHGNGYLGSANFHTNSSIPE